MTRTSIVKELNDRGYYKKQAQMVVDDVFDILIQSLVRKERVFIRGFGTFEIRKRKRQKIMNIYTGEVDYTNDYNVVVFKPGEILKAAVQNGKYDKNDPAIAEEQDPLEATKPKEPEVPNE